MTTAAMIPVGTTSATRINALAIISLCWVETMLITGTGKALVERQRFAMLRRGLTGIWGPDGALAVRSHHCLVCPCIFTCPRYLLHENHFLPQTESVEKIQVAASLQQSFPDVCRESTKPWSKQHGSPAQQQDVAQLASLETRRKQLRSCCLVSK